MTCNVSGPFLYTLFIGASFLLCEAAGSTVSREEASVSLAASRGGRLVSGDGEIGAK
jgi:hypothetical protein